MAESTTVSSGSDAPGVLPGRTRLSVERRREHLLEVGADLFLGRAYEKVSTEDIARAAGVSQGLLFHYFANKQEFYLAVLRRSADEFIDEVFAERAGEPLAQLVAGIEAYFHYVDRHAPRMRALLRGGVGGSAEVQEVIESTRLRVIERFTEKMPPELRQRGAELRAALYGWLGFIEAVALDHIEQGDLPVQACTDLVIRVLAAAVPELPELVQTPGA